MKRILSITLILSSLLLCLVSCGWFGSNNDDKEKNEEIIWSSEIDSFIVCDEKTTDTERLRSYIFSLTKNSPKIITPDEAVRAHEIVFGDVGRAISNEAYSRLDRRADLLALRDKKQSAYLIYASEGSIAIAYSDIYARSVAVDYILANVKDANFKFDGVLTYELLNTVDIVDKYREAEISKA